MLTSLRIPRYPSLTDRSMKITHPEHPAHRIHSRLGRLGLWLLVATWLAASQASPSTHAQSTPTEAYRLTETWESQPSALPPEAFLEPRGIDIDVDPFDGQLLVFVVDGGNQRVQVFGADGSYVRTIGGPGGTPEALADPRDVAVQGSLVFVTDTGHDRVALFTVDGDYIGEWPGLADPWGIAAGESGQIYVIENGASRVAVFNSDGSRPAVPAWGGFGGGFGQLNRPQGAAVTADGRLVIADTGNNRLVVYEVAAGRGGQVDETPVLAAAPLDLDIDPGTRDLFATFDDGRIRRYRDQLGLPEIGAGLALAGAEGIAAGRDTRPMSVIYATFQDDARPLHGVRRWEGNPPTAPATRPEWGGVPAPLGRIEAPFRVATGAGVAGALVADRWLRVQIFDAAGRALSQLPAGRLSDLAPAPDGGAFVAADSDVFRINPDGSTAWRQTLPTSGGDYAWAVALDYDALGDRLAVLDLGGQRVAFLTGAGTAVGGWSFRPAPGASVPLWDFARSADSYFVINRNADTLERRARESGKLTAGWRVPGRPVRVAADAAGNAYVLNWFGWVLKYDAGGDLRAAWSAKDTADDRSEPADLAVDAAGRVLVADSGLDRVSIFTLDPAGTPPPLPDFEPACSATGDKTADPTRLFLGEETQITLTIGGNCPPVGSKSDVLLVIDHSGSMLGPSLDAAKAAADAFVGAMDLGQDRVGLVGFNQAAQLRQPLTGNAPNIRQAIQGLVAGGGTDIAAGLDEARREMVGPRRRASAASVIVLLTDGFSAVPPALRAADLAKIDGARVFTIGVGAGVNDLLLSSIASTPSDYYVAPQPADLDRIYQTIARRIVATVLFSALTVTDELPANMVYVAGSGSPPPAVAGQTLVWQLVDIPLAGMALTYRVRPLEIGTHPTNVFALGEGTDGLGRRGRVEFPIPTVIVSALTGTPPPTPTPPPTATPTPTFTPTPSPTPSATLTPSATPTVPPRPIYLPVLRKEVCDKRRQHADVVLVIDTSDSMLTPTRTGRTKLAAAVDAAGAFVGLLDLAGGDAAAVVWFNSRSEVHQPLSQDTAALGMALASVPQGPGTRIDLGLASARDALAGPRRSPDNSAAVILLTDGHPSGTTEAAVEAAASELKAGGARIYAIGLGDDVDPALLGRIASDRADVILAPDAEELARVYAQIARELPCGGW